MNPFTIFFLLYLMLVSFLLLAMFVSFIVRIIWSVTLKHFFKILS